MKFRKFDNVRFEGDWEYNFIGKRWNLRIGRSQVALWRENEQIVGWVKK